jgi:hypothetical protein
MNVCHKNVSMKQSQQILHFYLSTFASLKAMTSLPLHPSNNSLVHASYYGPLKVAQAFIANLHPLLE